MCNYQSFRPVGACAVIHLFQHKVASETLKWKWSFATSKHSDVIKRCDFLLTGLKESSIMSHADSLLLAELEDEVRRQIGVVYSQDSQ